MKPPKRLRVRFSGGRVSMDVICNGQLIGNVFSRKEMKWIDYEVISFLLGRKHDVDVVDYAPRSYRETEKED